MQTYSPTKIFYGLVITISILLLLNILSYLNVFYNDHGPREFFFRKTNFNAEKNLPSIFSSLLHIAASILLGLIGFSKLSVKNDQRFWFSISLLLLFTGLDELLRIHEKVGNLIYTSFETSGIFLFAWVIPYGIAVIILGLVLIKPLFRLPDNTARNFIISGIVFLTGAVGLEMFTGWYISYYKLDLTSLIIIPDVFILSTIEELLEMLGMSLFIVSILHFLKIYKIPSTVSI